MAPLGWDFLTGPGLDYVQHAGGFPVEIPSHSVLTQRLIAAATGPLRDLRARAVQEMEKLTPHELAALEDFARARQNAIEARVAHGDGNRS